MVRLLIFLRRPSIKDGFTEYWQVQDLRQMATELEEHIPVITELGPGYAIMYHEGEFEKYWTVVLSTGAIVTFEQREIRVRRSYTAKRGISNEQMRDIIAQPMKTDREAPTT